MTTLERTHVGPAEIKHFAYLNWQNDGSPTGRDLAYWLEAECQLQATKHLILDEHHAGKRLPSRRPSTKPRKRNAKHGQG